MNDIISIPTKEGTEILMNCNRIEAFEAAEKHTDIFFDDGTVKRSTINLKYFADLVSGRPNFRKIHRSCIVNFMHLEKILKRQMILVMLSGKRFEVAKRELKTVLEFARNRGPENHKTIVEIGHIIVSEANNPQQHFSIRPGKQIIGRKSQEMLSDIMIDTENLLLSRMHLIIDANEQSNGNFVFTVSLYKPNVNKTFLNKEEMKSQKIYPLVGKSVLHIGRIRIDFLT